MKIENPTISVIIPAYNAAEYIEQCVDSVLNQSFKDFEVIIVNDGSKDETDGICQQYVKNDPRVKYFSQSNQGVSESRNKALELARGKWITFVDSDDWLDPSFLDTLINLWNEYGEGDWITSGIRYQYAASSTSIETPAIPGLNHMDSASGFMKIATQFLVTSLLGKCYRRDIIQRHAVSFVPRMNYAEDRDFNLKYLSVCNSCISSEYTGYNYRRDVSGSLSTRSDVNRLQIDIEYWEKLFGAFNKRRCFGEEARKFMVHNLYCYLKDYVALYEPKKEEINFIKTHINWQFLNCNKADINDNKLIKWLLLHKHIHTYLRVINLLKMLRG